MPALSGLLVTDVVCSSLAHANETRTERPQEGEWSEHGFAYDRIAQGTEVFTDDLKSYEGLHNHRSVRHSVGEYVDGKAHINGMESFWAMLKRGYYGTYHRLSPLHLQKYINEFAGRHNQRPLDTIDQMRIMAAGLVGKLLTYKDLIGRKEA